MSQNKKTNNQKPDHNGPTEAVYDTAQNKIVKRFYLRCILQKQQTSNMRIRKTRSEVGTNKTNSTTKT